MKFVQLSIDEFNEYAYHSNESSIFQSEAWAKLKSNWTPYYLGVKDNEELIAACLVLCRSVPFGFNFAYAPRGPLLNFKDKELLNFFISNIKSFLKTKKVLLAKFDPNIVIASYPFDEKEKVPTAKNDVLIQELNHVGLKHCGYTLLIKDTIQPRIQLVYPLEETFDHRIPSKTMKKVRASIKKDVIIKEEHDSKSLVAMVHCTEQRHQIKLRNEKYFNDILDAFKENACVLACYSDDILLSACLLVKSKNTTEILYSGYDDNYKQYNSTYPLRYESIRWAKEHGCTEFSFGGVEGTLDDGLTMFKSSFNPLIHVFVGEFDLLPIPLLSKLTQVFYPMLKKYIM
ncbi:lipid II:glycine glycyltransferase FemX [Anaerorhabdus furcosa]|uniref:Serine/alanine adding enzyme n=1 Tax=Anaerorhabdus furcosa TaxID=118967 RepID=A0A1T4PHH8_9FIRM|nr:peptidoglycan bridge formation glycyltransferase FemA/FemB family protein [Anaerorhabdus furcosa]SJZ90959.1 serine/alanine adding enzyme [Anaerorhabdus furcosa]